MIAYPDNVPPLTNRKRGEKMKESETLARLKESIRSRTRTMLEKVPPDKLNWSPVDGSLTLGQLLRHIWKSDEAVCKLARGNWEYLEKRLPQGLLAVLGEIEDLETELHHLEEAHREAVNFIRPLSDQELDREYHNEKLNVRRTTRDNIHMLIEHEAHHRGQISVYLRLLGIQGASPYGTRFK
jgi:uncharacterized damage-inducible protein DinB